MKIIAKMNLYKFDYLCYNKFKINSGKEGINSHEKIFTSC